MRGGSLELRFDFSEGRIVADDGQAARFEGRELIFERRSAGVIWFEGTVVGSDAVIDQY